MLSPLIPKALKSLRKNWERNWASGAERKKETLGRERPKIESRTQQHSKNWVCLPHTLLRQILLFLHYLEYFMFGKHLSSVVGPHKCWRWYNFLLLMLWWIFNFFINAFIKFLTNVWVTSPNLVEEKSGWAVWGVWRLEQLGGKAHVVDKIQEFWASIAEGAVQQFHAPCLLLSQLFSLEFSYQESLEIPDILRLQCWVLTGLLVAAPSCPLGKGTTTLSHPPGHSQWLPHFAVSSAVLELFSPLF